MIHRGGLIPRITIKLLLLDIEFLKIFNILLATEENSSALMDMSRYDIQNTLCPCLRNSTGLFKSWSHNKNLRRKHTMSQKKK